LAQVLVPELVLLSAAPLGPVGYHLGTVLVLVLVLGKATGL
jgi:hypothetical protein